MNINTALRAIESKHSSEVARGQAESGNVKASAEELAALLRGVSEGPTHEIEKLINLLQKLRTRLHDAGNRIQRDIAQHTEMSQQTMQLTAIISDGVKKLKRTELPRVKHGNELTAIISDRAKKLKRTELPRDNTPDMVATIRSGVMEQLKRERSGRPDSLT